MKRIEKVRNIVESDFNSEIENLEYFNSLPSRVSLSLGMASYFGISFIVDGEMYYGRVVLILFFWIGGVFYYKRNSQGKLVEIDIRNL